MTLERLKQKARELYNGSWDQRQIFIDETPKTLRHEDPTLGGSGTWIDVAVFVPDDDPT